MPTQNQLNHLELLEDEKIISTTRPHPAGQGFAYTLWALLAILSGSGHLSLALGLGKQPLLNTMTTPPNLTNANSQLVKLLSNSIESLAVAEQIVWLSLNLVFFVLALLFVKNKLQALFFLLNGALAWGLGEALNQSASTLLWGAFLSGGYWIYLEYLRRRQKIITTNQRLVVLNPTTDQPIHSFFWDKIQNTLVEQSQWESLWGVGSLILVPAHGIGLPEDFGGKPLHMETNEASKHPHLPLITKNENDTIKAVGQVFINQKTWDTLIAQKQADKQADYDNIDAQKVKYLGDS